MTKAELIFYEMTDREIFSRAKTVYEKLGMSEKGLLSVMRPTMGAVTILSVDLTNKIRDAVSIGIGDDNFSYLKKLDKLDGREADNTGFTSVEDMDKMTDEELYTEILRQYKDWLNNK